MRSPHCPTEFVGACALRHSLLEFIAASSQGSSFALFLRQPLDLTRFEGTCLAVLTFSELGTLKYSGLGVSFACYGRKTGILYSRYD